MSERGRPDPGTPREGPGEVVISVQGLTRHFGRAEALHGVDLEVRRGQVLGLVGVNGAGKTTLIRHLLGLLVPQAGTVRVLGLDPVADPVGVLSRVGHVAEDPDLPGWMRVREALRFTASFYPDWDHDLARDLLGAFHLEPDRKVNTLARGLRARLALLLAVGHRPDLLILDEPSAGLDPIARRDILQAVLRTVAGEGRTVLFSSHLLDEVERVADHIAFLDAGRVLFSGPLEDVRARHRRLTLRFPEPRERPPELAGVLAWEGGGREWTALVSGELEGLGRDGAGGEVVGDALPGLEELFAAHAGRGKGV